MAVEYQGERESPTKKQKSNQFTNLIRRKKGGNKEKKIGADDGGQTFGGGI